MMATKSDVLVVSDRSASVDHADPRRTSGAPRARADVMAAVVAERWAVARRSYRGAGHRCRMRRSSACTTAGYVAVHCGSTAGRRVRLDPDTYARRRNRRRSPAWRPARRWRRSITPSTKTRLPWPWSGRRATTRSGSGRWASACTTTPPSPRPTLSSARARARGGHRLRRASRKRDRSGSSTTIRACSTCLDASVPLLSGHGGGRRRGTRRRGGDFTVNIPLAAGAGDADLDRVFREVA